MHLDFNSHLYALTMSGNISRRLVQHVRSGKLAAADMTAVSRTEVLGGKTAREIAEQRRINELGAS